MESVVKIKSLAFGKRIVIAKTDDEPNEVGRHRRGATG